jgi:hypothetical protein
VLWAHGTEATVDVQGDDSAAGTYVHGDQMITFHHCRTCACVTHYASRPGGKPGDRVSVNMRMAGRETVLQYPVRTFDGADTWAFLD